MVNGKNVFWAVFLGLLAVLCWAIVLNENLSGWKVTFLIFSGIVLSLGAVLIALNYWHEFQDAHQYRKQKNSAINAETEELRLLTQMTPYQADIWFKRQVALVAIPGLASAELYYQVDNELIPAAFVQKWLGYCDGQQLAPKNRFSDGPEYEWADRLTAFYVNRGLAYPHMRGSGKAATWKPGISLDAALAWFHLAEA